VLIREMFEQGSGTPPTLTASLEPPGRIESGAGLAVAPRAARKPGRSGVRKQRERVGFYPVIDLWQVATFLDSPEFSETLCPGISPDL
jgi:hypothetical protein